MCKKIINVIMLCFISFYNSIHYLKTCYKTKILINHMFLFQMYNFALIKIYEKEIFYIKIKKYPKIINLFILKYLIKYLSLKGQPNMLTLYNTYKVLLL